MPMSVCGMYGGGEGLDLASMYVDLEDHLFFRRDDEIKINRTITNHNYDRTARSLFQRASHWDLFLAGFQSNANPGPAIPLFV